MSAKLIRLVSSGEYSDYSIYGLVLVETEDSATWWRSVVDEWTNAHPDEKESYHGSFGSFYEWLLARPDVKSVEFEELYIGAYGNFEPAVRK